MADVMTSRERVLTALKHEEPDRVPIDFGGMRSTGIALPAYVKLKEVLGITEGKPKLYDLMQWLAEPELPVLERMGGDVVQLHRYEPAFGINIGAWKNWVTPNGEEVLVPKDFNPLTLPDGSMVIKGGGNGDTVIARMPAKGYWFDLENHPLAGAKSFDDIDRFPWPRVSDVEIEFLKREAKRLHDETDYAILASFGGNIYESGHSDFGYETFVALLRTDRELAEYYMDKLASNWIEQLKKWLPAVKDYIHVVQVGDDLGMQTGPQMSPKMYRELIRPYQARVYQYIKENSGLPIFLHSCGSIYRLLPDIVEIGVDIINPVQYTATDMDPVRLKKEFGNHLTFWGGGCDTQQILPSGSTEQVRDEVKRMISIFAPNGGFVFTQVHNIQANIAPEKVLALYDTAREYGRYPMTTE